MNDGGMFQKINVELKESSMLSFVFVIVICAILISIGVGLYFSFKKNKKVPGYYPY